MKISAAWVTALAAAAFVATAASPAAAAPTATVQPAPATAAATQYCDASLTVLSQWATGYAAGFTVRNISTVTVRWQLSIRFVGPIWSMQVWNGTATQTGSVTVIVPNPSSGTLTPGQSTMVGAVYAPGSPSTAPPQLVVTCTPV